ncbi:hypothetical protein [uncultured Shimia sp.]|uniref:hypothetical protein n=1 Tax=uncultured Shimia sp. TaxID=573152 RepID=UPI00262AB8F6|nr:hypothetical protein [uncultured Shimia sp.]
MHLTDTAVGDDAKKYASLSEKHLEEVLKESGELSDENAPLSDVFNGAMAKNNLANVVKLRTRFYKNRNRRMALLRKSINLRTSALEVFTAKDFPKEPAMVNQNLVSDYGRLVEKTLEQPETSRPNLSLAFQHGMAAHDYYIENNMYWELFNVCLDLANFSMDTFRTGGRVTEDMLKVANGFLEAAEALVDVDKNPIYWAKIQVNRSAILFVEATTLNGDARENTCREALSCVDQALAKLENDIYGHAYQNALLAKDNLLKMLESD